MKLFTVFSVSRAFRIIDGSGDETFEEERIRKSEYGERLKITHFAAKKQFSDSH